MASDHTNEGASTSRPTKRARQSDTNVENVHDILIENDSDCSYVSSSDESIDEIGSLYQNWLIVIRCTRADVQKLAHCRFKG